MPAKGSTPRAGLRFWEHPALWSALAAIVLYLPTLRYGFVWDDHELIEASGLLGAATTMFRQLTTDFWAVNGSSSGFWRPLITFSYWLDGRLSHASPAWFHAMNLICHAWASAMVAAIAAQFGAAFVASLLAGLLFASMPTHVECVAFVSGRTDVYCAAFLLSAFWLDRKAKWAGARWPGWGATLLLAAALLSKEAAVSFVLLVAAADWIGRGRERFGIRRTLVWLIPYVIVTTVYLALHGAFVGFRSGGPSETDPVMVGRVRLAAIASFGEYLWLLLPWSRHVPGLAMKLPEHAWQASVWVGAMLQIALIAWLLVLLRRRRPAALPLALYWLALLPLTLIGLTQGRLLFGERFLYLPSAGAAWFLGMALERSISRAGGSASKRGARWPAVCGISVLAGLILVSSITLVKMLPAWTNDMTLAMTKVRLQPEYADSHAILADRLVRAGRDREAEGEAVEALRLDPQLALGNVVMAMVMLRKGLPDSALVHARRALAANPKSPTAHLLEGLALIGAGRNDEAEPVLGELVRDFPGDPTFEAAWGRVLLLKDRAADALPFLEHVVADATQTRDADNHYRLGMARAQLGQMAGARDAFTHAVGLNPRHYDAWLRLALASFTLGDQAGYEAALARAAALPQAADGRVEQLRRQVAAAAQSRPAAPNPR